MMARAITGDELTSLRADGAHCKLFLGIELPGTVYTARVNQATFTDPVYQVTFDGGSGTLEDVVAGMTLLVGSSAGAYDKGICRIRKAAGASTFYIGYESEADWANDLYLTVVSDFLIWAKPTNDAASAMDYDVAYSDQHDDLAPVAVMGPDAVVELTGDDVSHQRNASESWVLGSTISTYAWTATGPAVVVIDDNTAADPTFTFDTAGWYLIGLTVTAANGKTATGYRKTYVWDADNLPVEDFELESCEGSFEGGGWNFNVRLYDDATLAAVRDGAKVILFARDYYETVEQSLGALSGYENVLAIGRIDGESIDWNPDYTSVRFEVKGPAGWLGTIEGPPFELTGTGAAPTTWDEFEELTVDKALFHLLHWRSTVTAVMDVYLTDDTRLAASLGAAGGSLLEQMRDVSERRILAYAVCDRYGRLYVEIDTQVVASGSRSGFPTVMTLTEDDHQGLNMERKPANRTSVIEMSGIYFDGSDSTVLLSKAEGRILTRYGRNEPVDDMLFASQSEANQIAGDLLAWRNNLYKHIDIEMPQNNRFVDVAPRQYLQVSVASGDTVRGITLTNQKLISRSVAFEYDGKGFLTTRLECEAETTGLAGQTIPYIPPPAIGLLPFELGDLRIPPLGPMPNINFPPVVPTDPVVPGDPDNACMETDAPANGPYPLYLEGTYSSGSFASPGTYRRSTWIDCVLRGDGYDNETTYEIKGIFQKKVGGVWVDTTDDSWYAIKAYNGSEHVATGVHDAVTGDGRTRTGVFNYTGPITDIYMESNDNLRPSGMSVGYGHGLLSVLDEVSSSVNYSFYGGGIFVYATLELNGNVNSGNAHMHLTIAGVTWTGRTTTVTVAGSTLQTGGSGAAIADVHAGYFQSLGAYDFPLITYCNPVVTYAVLSGSYELIGSNATYTAYGSAYDGPSTTATLGLTAQFYMFLDELYRLQVTGASIYNVCPPGSEAE